MSPLADFLFKNRICTRDQIDDAVQNQVILGGRLGTNLVEMGYLDERTLAECLGRLHNVSALYGDAIEPEPAALALVPNALADRLSVVPYRASSRQMQVLCLDPNDFPTLDHVAFQTGRKVQPIVVAEVRLWQLLRQHYGIDRGLRGLALAALPTTAVTQVAAPPPPPSFAGDLMSEEAFDSLYQRRADDETGTAVPAQAPATAPPVIAPPTFRAASPASPTARSVAAPGPVPIANPPPAQPPLQHAVATHPTLPGGRTPTAQLPVLTGVVLEEITDELTLDDVIVEEPAIAAPPVTPAATTPATPTLAPSAPQVMPGPAVVPPLPLIGPPAPAPPPTRSAPAIPPPPAAAPPVASPVDESPLSFAEATTRLAAARDRDEVAQLVLRFARSQFKRAMLFTVHGRVAVGWDAVGLELTPLQFARLAIPLDQPSMFQLAVQSRAHVLGAPQKTPTNIGFLGAAGKQVPRSAFVMPVLVRGRVVNIFYGDNGHKEHCPSDVGELLILALKIAQSYESLFRAKVIGLGAST